MIDLFLYLRLVDSNHGKVPDTFALNLGGKLPIYQTRKSVPTHDLAIKGGSRQPGNHERNLNA